MNEYKIKELIFCGVHADPDLVREAARAAMVILARGNLASEWLNSIGVQGAITLEPTQDETNWHIDAINEHMASLIPDTVDLRLLYVTPLQPFAIDIPGRQLAKQAEYLVQIPGVDPLATLCTLVASITDGGVQSLDGLKILQDLFPVFSPSLSVVLYLADIDLWKTSIPVSLRQVYTADSPAYILEDSLSAKWQSTKVGDLGDIDIPLRAIYLPPLSSDASLESFMQVIARLRAPGGCPWDSKQTHTSLRPYLLEEAYEALEALDNGSVAGLREELGDILLQIALHSQIAAEKSEFTITEVIQGINRKIVSRHPHVFASVSVRDDRDVVQNWEKLKEIERAENGNEKQKGLLDGIPAILPALSQAQSIQDRAARVGFDWPDISPVIDKVMEEPEEVRQAETALEREHELGDLLFAVVNLVRWHKVDAESALRYTNTKFRKRFAHIEANAKKAGRELQMMTLEEMDKLWEDAKAFDD